MPACGSTIGRSATAICSSRRWRRAQRCATSATRTASGWLPTARGGALVRARRAGSACAPLPISAGGCRRSTSCSGRSARGRRDRRQCRDLDPERLAGVEAGLEYARGAARLSLTVFVNRLNDAIANVTWARGRAISRQVGFVAAGGTFRQRENVDAVKVRGIEASAEWTRGPWALRAGASFSHARMQASGAAAFLEACGRRRRRDLQARCRGAGNKTAKARSSCFGGSARSSRTTSTRRAQGWDDVRCLGVMAAEQAAPGRRARRECDECAGHGRHRRRRVR